MLPVVELQKWDSDFFGFRIGAINTSKDHSLEKLYDLIQSSPDYKCYYVLSDTEIAKEHLDRLPITHYILADVKLTYQKNLDNNCWPDDSRISEYSESSDLAKLYNLGVQSGHASRFWVDTLFRPYFKRMYQLWIDNSISKAIADKVYLHEDRTAGLIGMVTCKVKGKIGQIGLIATDETVRGKGIGSSLLKKVENFYISKSVYISNIVTQASNEAACAFYEKKGYNVIDRKFIYHLWR